MDLFKHAEARAVIGMTRASDHAERDEPGWNDRALSFLADFARTCSGAFLIERVREAFEGAGNPKPPDGRAWGHVARRAKRDGLIVNAGYAPATSSNNSPKVLWRAA
ncbi:MAG: hypothetical protein AAFR11_05530 [Pseudomonadota bacterium]